MSLPSDVWLEIFTHVSPLDILSLASTSHTLHALVSYNARNLDTPCTLCPSPCSNPWHAYLSHLKKSCKHCYTRPFTRRHPILTKNLCTPCSSLREYRLINHMDALRYGIQYTSLMQMHLRDVSIHKALFYITQPKEMIDLRTECIDLSGLTVWDLRGVRYHDIEVLNVNLVEFRVPGSRVRQYLLADLEEMARMRRSQMRRLVV